MYQLETEKDPICTARAKVLTLNELFRIMMYFKITSSMNKAEEKYSIVDKFYLA